MTSDSGDRARTVSGRRIGLVKARPPTRGGCGPVSSRSVAHPEGRRPAVTSHPAQRHEGPDGRPQVRDGAQLPATAETPGRVDAEGVPQQHAPGHPPPRRPGDGVVGRLGHDVSTQASGRAEHAEEPHPVDAGRVGPPETWWPTSHGARWLLRTPSVIELLP